MYVARLTLPDAVHPSYVRPYPDSMEWDWGSFLGAAIGAAVGAVATIGTTFLLRRDQNTALRKAAIMDIGLAFHGLMLLMIELPLPARKFPVDTLKQSSKIHAAVGGLDAHLGRREVTVAEWADAMVGEVLFAPSRAELSVRADTVQLRLMQWHRGRLRTRWFQEQVRSMERRKSRRDIT